MQRGAVGHSHHCKQLQVALAPPPFSPPTRRHRRGAGLDRADIIVFASFAALSGSWESDATGAHGQKCRNAKDQLKTPFIKVWQDCWQKNLLFLTY